MPDWREPLPDLPLPPNGRCASAPRGRVVDADHAGARCARGSGRRAAGSSCRSTATGRSRGRWPARSPRRSRRSARRRRAGRRSRCWRASSSARTPSTIVGCTKSPRSGSPTKPSRGLVGGDAPGAGRAVHAVVVADRARATRLEALEEALVDHRAVEHVLRSGRRSRRPRRRASKRARNSSWTRSCDDHGAQRRAALARGAEAAEQRALDGEVEVGVVHDHERVLAAELQARRLQVAPAQLADLARRPRSSR